MGKNADIVLPDCVSPKSEQYGSEESVQVHVHPLCMCILSHVDHGCLGMCAPTTVTLVEGVQL